MKKIIQILIITLFIVNKSMAQIALVAEKASIINSSKSIEGDIIQTRKIGDGLIILSKSNDYLFSLVELDVNGKPLWQREFQHICLNDFQVDSAGNIYILSTSVDSVLSFAQIDINQEGFVWIKILGKSKNAKISIDKDNLLNVISTVSNQAHYWAIKNSGEITIEKDIDLKIENENFGIICLSTEQIIIYSNDKILGLDQKANVLWRLGSSTELIKWKKVKELQNGEVVIVGQGVSTTLSKKDVNACVWSINALEGKILWAKVFGAKNSTESAIDFVEYFNNQLLILTKINNGFEIIKLDADHQKENMGKLNENIVYKNLFQKTDNSINLVGSQILTNEITLQQLKPRMKVISKTKSSLFLLSIGVKADLQFTKHDAEAIADNYKKQEGNLFKAVHTQILTADSNTKAGELAKAFELLSTKGIQNDDIVIIYFSGNGLASDDDYLLLGSDYDPAALRSTSIRMSQLLHDLDNLPGKKLILLDACYSGAAIKIPSNVSILTASTAQQPTFEDSEWQHGAFTKVILEAMKNKKADTNADNYTSLQELFDFTKKNLPILTQKKRIQNPLLLHKGDDFVVFEK